MTIHFCMPFWGEPADMRAAVASVLAQDDPEWLLTVIDDCYPDETVASFFAELNDDRVTYTRNERNVGITDNFRRAVAAVRAEHAVILGSDDLVATSYVSTMRRIISEHPGADVIQGGVQVIGHDGAPSRSLVDTVKQRMLTPRGPRSFRGEAMAASLLVGNWLYWPSLLFRTETLRRIDFRDNLPIILDLALLIDIALDGGEMHYDPTPVFFYRRHAASLSQKTIMDGSRFEDERAYYRDAASTASRRRWTRARRAAEWRIMSRLHGLSALPTVLRRGSSRARRAALALAFAR